MESPIERAVSAAGGVSALARAIGVTPPTVHQWVSGTRPIPEERCPDIEAATNGEVKCEELESGVEWIRDKRGAVTGYTVKVGSGKPERKQKAA